MAVLNEVLAILDRHGGKGIAHPIEPSPMGGCMQTVQESGGTEQHRAGANCRQHFYLCGAGTQPVEHDRIFQLLPETPSAWDDNNVYVGAIRKRVVRQDFHTARRSDRARALRHQKYLEGRGFFSPFLVVQPGDREHLEWPAEVEHFDILNEDNANALSFHLNLRGAKCSGQVAGNEVHLSEKFGITSGYLGERYEDLYRFVRHRHLALRGSLDESEHLESRDVGVHV